METWWGRLWLAVLARSMATVIPAVMIPTGITGLVLGEDSSRAFTLISAGPLIAHGFGTCLALGGMIVLYGITREDALIESVGLTLLVLGALMYATGVFIGLGVNGLIAGGLATGIGLGALGRIRTLVVLGRRERHKEDD